MSQIKLKHSGGNSSIIAAPSSNPASDVTFRLPNADGSAGQFMKTDGSGNLAFAAGGGITMVDNWYVNAQLQPASGTNTISANWERGTSAQFGSIGSAMTQSSGIFTFPSTGIYYCSINGGFFRGSGYRRYVGFTLQTTSDNGSNYTSASSNYDSISGDTNDNTSAAVTTTFVFDVTNTSTHKVRFQTEASDSGTTITSVNGRYLNVLFMRLGDT